MDRLYQLEFAAMVFVLIIDDDEDSRRALTAALRERGHVAFGLANDSESIRVMVAVRPDALLLGICLAGRGGFEVLQELRRRGGGTLPFPVAVMTSFEDSGFAERAKELGVRECLRKGPDGVEAIANFLARLVLP